MKRWPTWSNMPTHPITRIRRCDSRLKCLSPCCGSPSPTTVDGAHPPQNADDRSLGLAIMRAVTTFPHVIRHTHGTTVVLFAGLAIRRSRGRIMLPPAYASRCSTDSVSRQEKHY